VATTRITKAERAQVAAAVHAAEQQHRGEIVLHVEAYCLGDPLKRAAKVFHARGFAATQADTAVLIYVATLSRKAAVWAGRGIPNCDQLGTWQPALDALSQAMAKAPVSEALCIAVAEVGKVLRSAVPGPDRGGNELADGEMQ